MALDSAAVLLVPAGDILEAPCLRLAALGFEAGPVERQRDLVEQVQETLVAQLGLFLFLSRIVRH